MFLTRLFQEQLANTFERYGRFVSRNAVASIFFCILLNGLLGLNIIWMKTESDVKTMYTPRNSRAEKDSMLIKKYFPDSSCTNFYEHNLHDFGRYGSLIIKHPEDRNMLNISFKPEIKRIINMALNITITYKTKTYSYYDICAKINNTCIASQSVLLSDYFWEQVMNNNVSYPSFQMKNGEINTLNQTLGGVRFTHDKNKILVRAFKMMFYLCATDEFYKSLAKEWEDEFLKVFRAFVPKEISIAYANSRSLNDELASNTGGDVGRFSLTFTLMITYASLAAAGGNWISQRGHLARAGVIASSLAILGAFGLCSAAGIEFVNIVGVMPFLIVGIGLDDVFILMSALANVPLKEPPDERVGKAVRTSGIAVTITSLTSVTAFAAGTASPFQSVRNFCIYTGVAVLLCYINQMTFFVGCMSIHEKRVFDKRHCVTCVPTKSASEFKKDGANICKVIWCSGAKPVSRRDQESCFERLPTFLLPRLVLWLPMKIAVLLGTIAYLGLSVWGTINLKQGLLLRNLVSESSYYHFYSNWNFDYFPSTFTVSLVVPSKIEYSNLITQQKLENIINVVKMDKGFSSSNEINWFNNYKSSPLFYNATEETFCLNLKLFLLQYPIYTSDIVFGENCTIVHSRIHLITGNIKESYDQGQLMLRIRKLTDESEFNLFPFSPAFVYFEQYVAILPNTLQTMGIAVAAVFVVTCIFLSHPLVIIFVSISMAMMMVGLFGFMHFWGLSLSSVTMIHIIMSVGFSVDYSAHICHAFLVVEGENRSSRVSDAIIQSGGPIFNGAMSSLIGIMILSTSESYVFTSFFKIMLLVILFGLGQAILFLPVLLSILGPHKRSGGESNIVFNKEVTGQINLANETHL